MKNLYALLVCGTALLVASPAAFGWLRLAGAAYLAWIGIGLIARPHHPGTTGGITTGSRAGGGWTAFRRGLLTNLLNPKVGVFYLTLFPQFLPTGASDPAAGLILAGVQITMTLVWFAGLIAFARRLAPIVSSPAFARRIDRVCGVIFIGFGLKLAVGKA